MLSPGFIPCPLRASRRARVSTFPTCRCGNSTKGNSTSAWITPSPARTPSSPASATIRRPTLSPAARPDSPNPAPSPARRTSPTTGATSRYRKPTSFPIAPSTRSAAATTAFSTTSCRLVTAPAKPRSSAFRAQISTAAVPVFRAALLPGCPSRHQIASAAE